MGLLGKPDSFRETKSETPNYLFLPDSIAILPERPKYIIINLAKFIFDNRI